MTIELSFSSLVSLSFAHSEQKISIELSLLITDRRSEKEEGENEPALKAKRVHSKSFPTNVGLQKNIAFYEPLWLDFIAKQFLFCMKMLHE